ncbi:MAG: class I SAM-dependent methyltransferase [Paracoccaceae bacterium]
MTRPPSPYHAPGFYDDALARGRHRDIVGGRWDETGRLQLAILRREGLEPRHRLLDIGCGSLRLGSRAVPFLDPGHYWGTDLSGALMQRGHELELEAKDRLPPQQLIEDGGFAFPGVPGTIDYAIAFAVFTHLPDAMLALGLSRIRAAFPALNRLLFTIFLAPETGADGPHRQPDGVVTHPDRAPWHLPLATVEAHARAAGFALTRLPDRLPRGQVLFRALPR